ncbi:ArnT family glycosyltransferase [Arsenicibacter rosenii]|nr:hypothetical protein [Arsenicibacter rosenii]
MPPQRDSGVFAYIGQRILRGELPYRDIWDHKPPLVYYINALGLWLKPTIAGVIYLQVLFTTAAAFFIFLTLKKLGSPSAGLLAAGFFLINILYLNDYGNETEQWALPFQTLALYLSIRQPRRQLLTHVAIGICAGIAFFLRQNLIGYWITYALVPGILWLRGDRTSSVIMQSFGGLMAGFGAVTAIVTAYIGSKGIWSEFYDAVFTYNFAYISVSFSDKVKTALNGWASVQLSTVPGFAYLLILWSVFTKKYGSLPLTGLLIVLIGLPVEIGLSALSGRIAGHYYLPWLPVSALAIGLAWMWMETRWQDKLTARLRWGIVGVLTMAATIKPYLYLREALHNVDEYHERFRHREQMAEAILQYTAPEEYFLEWGIPDGMNFLTDRKAPTRFIYQWALDTPGYTSPALVDLFVDEVMRNPPVIIMDSSLSEHLPPLDPGKRYAFYQNHPERIPMLPQNIVRFYQFLGDNYQQVGGNRIGFYMRKDRAATLPRQ